MPIVLLFILLFSGLSAASAASFSLEVRSKDAQPAKNLVIYLTPTHRTSAAANTQMQSPAVMDQINKQFVPHILVVQKNALVLFPNSDSIKHHVYSFSPAKPFELKLYSGDHTEPLPFDKAGEVVVGCNIHDWMLGYIYVVDTPWYGKTDRDGKFSLDLPIGEYELKIWSPLLQGADLSFSKLIQHQSQTELSLQLSEKMSPALKGFELNDEIEQY